MGAYILAYSILCLLWAAVLIAIAMEHHGAAAVALVSTMLCIGLLAGSNVRIDALGTTEVRSPSGGGGLRQSSVPTSFGLAPEPR
jgi:hypothetical protein